MIKVEIWEVYGQGAMGSKYWDYRVTTMHRGSVKKAIAHARRKLWTDTKDREGFNWIPVILEMRVWVNGKLLFKRV